jgi:hypothetical protein
MMGAAFLDVLELKSLNGKSATPHGAVLLLQPKSLPSSSSSNSSANSTHSTSSASIARQITRAARFMPPPFDAVLADESSGLVRALVGGWAETQELIADGYSWIDLISEHVAADDEMLDGTLESYEAFVDATMGNASEAAAKAANLGRASILLNIQPTRTLDRWDFLEQLLDLLQPSVIVGQMNENWGYLSTKFTAGLQRSANWTYVPRHPNWTELVTNNSLVKAIFVVQHHNFSDPASDAKILSLPLGPSPGQVTERALLSWISSAPRSWQDRPLLVFLGGFYGGRQHWFEDFAFRGLLKANETKTAPKRQSFEEYLGTLSRALFVWSPPGLGVDCRRTWEALLAGSIPVMERGFGLERTLAFLPVFFVEDFALLTEEELRNAYPVFIALRHYWRFNRLASHYWRDLVNSTAAASTVDSSAFLVHRHPFPLRRIVWPCAPEDCQAPHQRRRRRRA